MNDEIKIRAATALDAAGIAQVHVASWRATYRGVMPDQVLDNLSVEDRTENWKRGLTHPKNPMFALVAIDDNNKVVGFVSGGPPQTPEPKGYDAEMYAIYVDPEVLRQGIGTRLTEAFVSELNSRGYLNMILWVLDDNPNSRKFYAAFGGQLVGEKLYDVGGEELPVVAYGWKTLDVIQLKS